VPVDLVKSIRKKDKVDPSTGRSHAPGKTYRPLERFIPKLQSALQAVCDAAIGRLRKPADDKAPGPSSAPPPSSSAPSTSKPAAKPSTSGTSSKKTPKATRQKKAKKAKQKKADRKILEKFVSIRAPNGTFIEDKHGPPLIVLIQDPFGQGEEADQVNVSALLVCTNVYDLQSTTNASGPSHQGSNRVHSQHQAIKDIPLSPPVEIKSLFSLQGIGVPLCNVVGHRATC